MEISSRVTQLFLEHIGLGRRLQPPKTNQTPSNHKSIELRKVKEPEETHHCTPQARIGPTVARTYFFGIESFGIGTPSGEGGV